MENIQSFFPKHILCRDTVCVDHIDDFKFKLLEIKKENQLDKEQFLHVQTSHRLTGYSIQQDPLFQPLIREIKQESFNFACFLGYSFERAFLLEIKNMWFNISDEHDYQWPHIHPGSIISGAYYVENEIEDNNLTFFDNPSSIEYPIDTQTDHWWGSDRVNIPVKKGRLLLFRSDFMHGTTPQIGKGTKITISFNIL